MSETYLILIPTDPYLVPPESAQTGAYDIFARSMAEAAQVTMEVHDAPIVVHPAENWQGVRCPHCRVPLEDYWWSDAVSTAFEDQFRDLFAAMPCCGKRASLNDLDYKQPVGFARFTLFALNPPGDIAPDMKAELERVLGTPLRRVWQRS